MTGAIEHLDKVGEQGKSWGDLRDWIRVADEIGLLRSLNNADWDLEIGGLTEMVARRAEHAPSLLFDNIKGYPTGWRVLTNAFNSRELSAIVLGLQPDLSPEQLVAAWQEKARKLQPAPVQEVTDGPVFENVLTGTDIDLYAFPTPRWHEHDGGRYLGTGDIVVTRDPENGQLNVGTYRMMIQDRDKIGLYISPGHHGRLHREKYFARREPLPVIAAFGMDPVLFLAGSQGLPVSTNEYEWAGAVKGAPIEVVPGPVTGLPIPASAEIVIEGYVYPDRFLDEGPFGEWTGYYASAVRQETYVQVEALYHRNDPIILGSPPMRPPSQNHFVAATIQYALILDALEAAGIPDVRGVAFIPSTSRGMLVISIKQRYAGHAKQAALVASQSRAGAYLGRYVIVVDEDIDPHNLNDVLWAVWSRSDPEESTDLIRNCWSTPLDPRIPPDKRAARNFTNSRMVIDATRPFHWRDQFPPVAGASAALESALRDKWGEELLR